jgi:hypothetical protein
MIYFVYMYKSRTKGWALLAHTCNPSYLGGRDQENHGLKLAWANSSQDPILKISNTKQGWQSGSNDRGPD